MVMSANVIQLSDIEPNLGAARDKCSFRRRGERRRSDVSGEEGPQGADQRRFA
jgi:hypothetical protein